MLNFRKITAIASTVLLTGMTVGIAAAAAFPAPFVASGASGTAVVYGASADPLDATQANAIGSYLAGKVGGSVGVPTSGDYVLFDKGSKSRLSLGSNITSIYTTLDDGHLSTVLKDGVYLNDDNNEYKYTQEIRVADLALSHFRDTSSPFGYDPTIGFNLASGAPLLNYTLDFTDAAVGSSDWSKLENTNIEMLGKNFFISDVTPTTNGLKITLLDSANSALVSEGETQTMTVGGKTYTVSIQTLSGSANSPQVKLSVNGELTNSLSEGNTYKLSDGTYVGIKDISMRDVAGTSASVEFSVGTGQIILENGQTVVVNNEDVDELEDANEYQFDVISYITNTSTTLEEIKLEWKTDSKVWVAPGIDISMPGFDAIKLSMGDFVAPGEEITSLKDGSDNLEVSTVIYDGPVTLQLLYANSSITGFAGLGEDSNRVLVTNSSVATSSSATVSASLNEAEDSFFVVTWISGNRGETYAFELSKIDHSSGKNATTLKNLVSGGSEVVISEVGKTKDYGQVTFKLQAANDDSGTATIQAYPVGGSGSVYMDRVVTRDGLRFMLPIDTSSSLAEGNGIFITNTTAVPNPTSWKMVFREEDSSNNIDSGTRFNVTVGLEDGDGVEITGQTLSELEMGRGTKVYEAFVTSALATKVVWDRPTSGLNELDVYYNGDEAYGQVYLSEIGASSSGGSAGNMVFRDNEKSSWENKNVVLVGGSCINTATAQALGVPAGTCTTAFTSETGVGSGQYLIQSVGNVFASGKIALVVAGYSAEDTRAAATKLINEPETIDTSAGNKYHGVVVSGSTSTLTKV